MPSTRPIHRQAVACAIACLLLTLVALVAPAANAQDLRSPDARDVARPRHEVATTQMRPVAKASTWPAHPQAIAVKPVATDSGSGGVDWASIGIALGGTVLLTGAAIALVTRTRRRTGRAHVAA